MLLGWERRKFWLKYSFHFGLHLHIFKMTFTGFEGEGGDPGWKLDLSRNLVRHIAVVVEDFKGPFHRGENLLDDIQENLRED